MYSCSLSNGSVSQAKDLREKRNYKGDKILNHIISIFLFFEYSGKENETSLIYLQLFIIH